MSGFASEPVRSDEHELATGRHGGENFTLGQGHDRIPEGGCSGRSTSMTMNQMSDTEQEIETEITASQKMLSAVSGSLLTSLLGEPQALSGNVQYSILTRVECSHPSRRCSSSTAVAAPYLYLLGVPAYIRFITHPPSIYECSPKSWRDGLL